MISPCRRWPWADGCLRPYCSYQGLAESQVALHRPSFLIWLSFLLACRLCACVWRLCVHCACAPVRVRVRVRWYVRYTDRICNMHTYMYIYIDIYTIYIRLGSWAISRLWRVWLWRVGLFLFRHIHTPAHLYAPHTLTRAEAQNVTSDGTQRWGCGGGCRC